MSSLNLFLQEAVVVQLFQLSLSNSLLTFFTEQVIVLESSGSPEEQPCPQRSVREELETEAEEADAHALLKRATIFWERTLEDVIEDEGELTAENSGLHEMHCGESNILNGTEPEAAGETPSQAADEDDEEVIIGKEEYRVYYCFAGRAMFAL